MKHIDTKTWKEFKISDLFETNNEKAYTGASVKRENLIPGETPRVTVSNVNNGITGYYEDIEDTNYRVYNNFISVSFLGTVFYHPYSASVDMKVHVLPKLTNGRELTTGIGLFLVSAIKASIKRYTYANQISSKVIYDTYIQLPVDQTGQPDWDYMEAFMEQINQQAQARLNEHKEGKLEYTTLDSKIGYTPVDTKSWAEFKVGDLFDVRPTKAYKLNRHDLIDNGPNPVLANSSHNNGISGYTTLECTEKGGFISFSDTTSGGDTMFYQPVPVVGYSHVQGMFPIDVELNEYKAQYLISVIRAHLGGTWNYINKLTRKHMEKLKIQLPVDSTGQPDWDYMEAFMKQINQQAQAKLNQLEKGNI